MQIKSQSEHAETVTENSKLYIQSPLTAPAAEQKKEVSALQENNKTPVLLPEAGEKPVAEKGKSPLTGKKSLLESLRDQHITNRVSENKKDSLAVTSENLEEHWNCFKEKLKKQSKHSLVTVFSNAQLKVTDEENFSVTVSTTLEQKFIEQEKTALLEYLKDCFSNRNIGFAVLVTEQPKDENTSEPVLTTREKYQKVIEQYPLIKELKDRLKLELDY